VLAFTVTALTVPASAAAADDGTLIVADPLPGFGLTEGGSLNGPIDAGTLLEVQGTDPKDVPKEAREFKGEARTWRNTEGSTAIAFVLDCGDIESASDFLHGALEGSTKTSDGTFDSGMVGSAGFVVGTADQPVRSVLWRQSHYFVEVIVVGAAGASISTVTTELANDQAAFLQPRHGAPTLDTSAGKESNDTSVAYQVGRLAGTSMIVGFVVLLIRNRQRRRAEQRAHEARFALPPPPFVRPVTAPPQDE
jgi:hypothetical protein